MAKTVQLSIYPVCKTEGEARRIAAAALRLMKVKAEILEIVPNYQDPETFRVNALFSCPGESPQSVLFNTLRAVEPLAMWWLVMSPIWENGGWLLWGRAEATVNSKLGLRFAAFQADFLAPKPKPRKRRSTSRSQSPNMAKK